MAARLFCCKIIDGDDVIDGDEVVSDEVLGSNGIFTDEVLDDSRR